MEKIKVYLEAVSFLFSAGYQKILKKLDEVEFGESAVMMIIFVIASLLGWVFLFYPNAIYILLGLNFIWLFKELGFAKSAAVQVLSLLLIFMISSLISLFYDYDNIHREVKVSITDPVYEVTSDSNFVLQKGKATAMIELDSKKFTLIKNSNCSEITKVKIRKNNKKFSEVYDSISTEILCDGKKLW